MNNQDIKADAGKPQLTLVPRQIIFDIAKVREYGIKKYGERESWKKVDIQRYREATFRHFMAYLDNPQGIDAESGLPHLSHLACNIAFLCELEEEKRQIDEKEKAFLNHLRKEYEFERRKACSISQADNLNLEAITLYNNESNNVKVCDN